MEIISIPFALLAIASIFVFYILNPKYRIVYLAVLSCCFVASYHFYLLIYVLGYSLLNFLIGIKIPETRFKKTLFRTGIILNLSQLITLKYASFAIDPFFQIFNSPIQVSKLSQIIIPLGISYFTLQGIGYLINIKMGWEKPERRFWDFLLYIIFYPKFISGPLERSNHFLPQLKVTRPFNEQQVNQGLKIALIGFFKKVVIANQLATIVTVAYSDPHSYAAIDLWIVMLVQPLYLYFDFSGYTDIAIGFAKTFGIDLLPNFNKPFLSESVTTFWRRFHMSLSLWFNDYVFKQVSFRYRRWGKYASVFTVFITFMLFGIWHGAGWNFMVLGFIQALAINYEFFTKNKRTEIFLKIPRDIKVWSGRTFTYLFFGMSLIFFFSSDLNSTFNFFSGMTNLNSGLQIKNYGWQPLAAIGLSLFFLIFEFLEQDYIKVSGLTLKYWNKSLFFRIAIYYLMVVLIMAFIGKKLTFVYQIF
jgi:D-alanyl-lipoteichoic acid acyltransferase DltB (MBOAT superfamily)